jgi:predicted nicotinamide N-methyase
MTRSAKGMQSPVDDQRVLRTTAGEFPLNEYRLGLLGREWSILHVGSVLTREDENRFLGEQKGRLPYGVALWPSSIALAHDLVSRADDLRDKRVLELGAGTGLAGIVAASLSAEVVQTDRDELAMYACKRNCERNRVETVEHRLADWTSWEDAGRYDWIIGSDILYGVELQPHLRRIFESNLAAGGRVLLSDPFRAVSLGLLETMEEDGWSVTLSKWSVGEEATPRPIAVFELTAP